MRSKLALTITLMAAVAAAEDASPLKTPKQKYSYALGMDFGKQIQTRSVELDQDLFSKGLRDVLSGGKALLTEEEIRASIAELQADLKRKVMQAGNKNGAQQLKSGESFLADNRKKEGVVTLPSGLQYKVVKSADGRRPTDADTVVCQYRGTLLDGTEFDSSFKRNQPAAFAVKDVIPGWREALKLMAVGSKYQLFIPPELAYGERGAGSQIGPNETLIFEVELMAIQ
jgi:UDP-GlcNAc:undecaprenyl-phosphate/decaprenyl-phosphate GlcNAc-1-phosphate transferase